MGLVKIEGKSMEDVKVIDVETGDEIEYDILAVYFHKDAVAAQVELRNHHGVPLSTHLCAGVEFTPSLKKAEMRPAPGPAQQGLQEPGPELEE